MWLYVPNMTGESSQVVPVLADLISASSSLAPDRELPLTSSGKLMQPRQLYAAWKKGRLTELRSGLTSAPSILDAGVDSWIASSVDIPASQTALPEKEKGKPILAGSGHTLPESSESFDLSGVSLRTSPTTYVWDSCASTMTFESWATKLRRACSRRTKWARAMRDKDSSLWPTVLVPSGGRKNSAEEIASKGKGAKGKRQLSLESVAEAWMKQWATCVANPANGTAEGFLERKRKSVERGNSMGVSLTDLNLQAQEWVKQWATPRVAGGMTHKLRDPSTIENSLRGADSRLEDQVSVWIKETLGNQWSTVRASDGEKGGPNQAFGAGGVPLTTQACQLSRLLHVILTGGSQSSPDTLNSALRSLRLNPLFCEWLMGWCLGHTGSEVAEMEWFRWWQLMRGELWRLHCATLRMNEAHCFELTTE